MSHSSGLPLRRGNRMVVAIVVIVPSQNPETEGLRSIAPGRAASGPWRRTAGSSGSPGDRSRPSTSRSAGRTYRRCSVARTPRSTHCASKCPAIRIPGTGGAGSNLTTGAMVSRAGRRQCRANLRRSPALDGRCPQPRFLTQYVRCAALRALRPGTFDALSPSLQAVSVNRPAPVHRHPPVTPRQ